MAQWWEAPFFQVALPIVLAQFLGFVWQNKRFDDFNRRFDDLRSEFNHRFDEIDRRFNEVDRRLDRIDDRDIAALKERTGIVLVD